MNRMRACFFQNSDIFFRNILSEIKTRNHRNSNGHLNSIQNSPFDILQNFFIRDACHTLVFRGDRMLAIDIQEIKPAHY